MKQLIFILLTMFSINSLQSQSIPAGDIFSDHFSPDSKATWTDMKAWGFGVWQVQNHQFTSLDPAGKALCSAIPKFENAIVNRDYCVRFRFKPVSGSNYLFTIQVRQDGWSHYKIEIGLDGQVKIVKAALARWPETLFATTNAPVTFDEWHWLRLDVFGENPVILRVKIWQGTPDDEPAQFTAAAGDEQPLQAGNLNFALTMLQEGGAHTILESFNIYRHIPVASQWRWHSQPAAKRLFEQRHFSQAIAATKTGKSTPTAKLNNLAIINAARGQLDRAREYLKQALKISPTDPILRENLKWFSILLARQGLVQDTAVPLNISLNRQVGLDDSPAELKLTLFHSLLESQPESGKIEISVQNDSGKICLNQTLEFSTTENLIIEKSLQIAVADLPDGKYRIQAKLLGTEISAVVPFEVIREAFQAQWQLFKSLEQATVKTSTHLNNRANLAVEFRMLQRIFRDCEQPGNFALYRGKIAGNLAKIQTQLDALQKGSNPFAHQTGQFLRGYFSEIEGSLQAYAVWVPPTYSAATETPVVINLHGYDPSFSSWEDNPFLQGFNPAATAHNRYLLVNPFGRGNTAYQNIGEADVLEVLAEVRRLYHIDENRIYLTGGSMGGAGTWNIGLSYPDLFAAIAPIMGPTDFLFWTGLKPGQLSRLQQFIFARNSALFQAENARNLPVFCNHGVRDDIVPIEQSRKMEQRFHDLGYPIRYEEHPAAAHGGFAAEMYRAIYDWFEPLTRVVNPKKVTLCSGHLKHNRSHWVTLEAFEKQTRFAQIDAEILSRQKIQIQTQNVARFSLELNPDLVETREELQITIDETTIIIPGIAKKETFVKAPEWQLEDKTVPPPILEKTSELSGPLSEAFNSGFLLVYGTTGSPADTRVNHAEVERFSRQWEAWQHVPCRAKTDTAVTAADIHDYNLILLGAPQTNRLTQKVNSELPIRFEGDAIVTGTETFRGAGTGLALIYPNPLNPAKYVVVLAGITRVGTQGIVKRIGTEFDYIIFDEKTMGLNLLQGNLAIEGTPLLCGFFDHEWQLDSHSHANLEIRNQIVPRRLPDNQKFPVDAKMVYLSDFAPVAAEQMHGLPEFDRNCWGQKFTPNSIKGIGVFPNSTLQYQLQGDWKNFSVILAPAFNPYFGMKTTDYQGGKFQFGIYGDGEALFVSKAMTADSQPQKMTVDIQAVRELKLVVRTQNWLPNLMLGASWVGARLSR